VCVCVCVCVCAVLLMYRMTLGEKPSWSKLASKHDAHQYIFLYYVGFTLVITTYHKEGVYY